MFISPRLPAAHRARETVEMMTLTIGMLVTFAALVLGLITASVKTGYDDAVHDRQEYALQLTELDRCLRNYGPGADPARAYIMELHSSGYCQHLAIRATAGGRRLSGHIRDAHPRHYRRSPRTC
jgi:hypothetical protein